MEEPDDFPKEEEETPFHVDPSFPVDVINTPVNSLQDLINLGQLSQDDNFLGKNYSINVKGLYQMTPALQELQGLIGLSQIKTQVLDQIIFFQNRFWHPSKIRKLIN